MAVHPLPHSSISRRVSLAAFGAITLVLIGVGYWYYSQQIVELTREKYQALSAIGVRKSERLEQWRKERLSDTYRLSRSFVEKTLADFLSHPDDAKLRAPLRKTLKLELTSDDAVDVLLVSLDGTVLASARDNPPPIAPKLRQAIGLALASQEPVFSEFYREQNGGTIFVDTLEAIRDAEGRPLAIAVIRNDANSYLFPMVQSWPLPSRSAETLLIQREGEEVVYLNRLRHRPDGATLLREPMSLLTLPAVQAVLGKQGIFEGKDYRGVPVLSDLRAIPKSDWFVVAKVDLAEIFAEARFRAIAISLIVGAFVLMFAGFISFLYWQWNVDVAEREGQAEQEKLTAVRETQAILQAALDTSPMGIAVADAPAGTLRYVNDAGLLIRGGDRQSIVNGVGLDRYVSSWQLFDLDGQPLPLDEIPLARAIRHGETCSREFIIRRAIGDDRIVRANASPIRDHQNNIVAGIVIFMDITHQKAVEQNLQSALAGLERSNRDLEQFASIASHDLQEPLRMVASYTQLLAQRYEGQLDEKAQKYIRYAVDGAVRMQALINDLLAYSRVGTRGIAPQPVGSLAALEEALRNLSAKIEESRATITHGDLPAVQGDALQLSLLFQNLVANAIKFCGKDLPRIHISAQDREGEFIFAVKDNGIGIEPQHADRVFVIFQRLHTREEYPGTGIGLAVCRRIVERHGGKIWFESVPGSGTTFFFSIPK